MNIPASILNQMQAAPSQGGEIVVESTTSPSTGNGLFNAPLIAGGTISNATFLGLVGTGGTATYQ
jgi:hypothetical protein